MELPPISLEQESIIDNLKNGYNVIVDSVAGSGKTTSNLYIAKTFADKNILLLTYNAKLKLETREKISKLELKNMEVHSYHSFCVKYYDNKCYTDSPIRKMLSKNKSPIKEFKYDIIILDESQDITPMLYELICKISRDNMHTNTHQIQLCLLGDKNQSIYEFKYADARFLSHADKLFNFNNLEWKTTNLATSFRITKEMANFTNMLTKDKRLHAIKNGDKPTYLICNTFNDKTSNKVYQILLKFLRLGYKPDEFFILAPSLKSKNSPCRQLENIIKKYSKDISIFAPINDDEALDEEVIKNKLVFSTFHQSKGLERKCVIVFGFDDTYCKFIKKECDPYICPNEIYVATTRAKEQLILVHHYKNDYFKFIDIKYLEKYCNISYKTLNINYKSEQECHTISVSQLISHLNTDIVDNIIEKIVITQIKDISTSIDIPMKIESNDGMVENVSEITGTCIPAYYEYLETKKMSIYGTLHNRYKDNNIDNFIFSNNTFNFNSINLDNITIPELLFIGNLFGWVSSGYMFKVCQIKEYTWLSRENLNKCLDNLKTLNLSTNIEFEFLFDVIYKGVFTISGYCDCIDELNKNVYEFKCIKDITNEHILQLICYAFLNEINIRELIKTNNDDNKLSLDNDNINKYFLPINIDEKDNRLKYITLDDIENINNNLLVYDYYIYNILTDESKKINCTYNILLEIIDILLEIKYGKKTKISDDEFIKQMCEIKTSTYNNTNNNISISSPLTHETQLRYSKLMFDKYNIMCNDIKLLDNYEKWN